MYMIKPGVSHSLPTAYLRGKTIRCSRFISADNIKTSIYVYISSNFSAENSRCARGGILRSKVHSIDSMLHHVIFYPRTRKSYQAASTISWASMVATKDSYELLGIDLIYQTNEESHITSLPACRETLRAEKTHRYVDFKLLKLHTSLRFYKNKRS
jgi:hypothetical protein